MRTPFIGIATTAGAMALYKLGVPIWLILAGVAVAIWLIVRE